MAKEFRSTSWVQTVNRYIYQNPTHITTINSLSSLGPANCVIVPSTEKLHKKETRKKLNSWQDQQIKKDILNFPFKTENVACLPKTYFVSIDRVFK